MLRCRPGLATIGVNSAEEDEMGALLPIGGGADAEIKGRLNAAFDDTNIVRVRGVVANEDLFDGQHHLHRLAYRLGAYPIKPYSGDDAKGKWFYFLKIILRDAAHNGVSTTKSINKILSYAMRTPGVKRIVFDAVPGTDPTLDHYVDPGNPVDDADIALLVDTTGTWKVSLVCPSPLPDKSSPVPNQSGDVDGEERPPIKIFIPKDLAPPVLSKTTRKPQGKAKKKPTSKKKTKKTKSKKGSKK
jgi:hypothetical protein